MDADELKKIEELENAIIEYTRPGEKINFAQSNRPGTSFTPFIQLILHMVAISTGTTYELISGDYQNLSYSNIKIIRADFMQHLQPIANRHIRQFCYPVFKLFMESAVLSGLLPFKDYFQDPYKYLAGEWQLPGLESYDPLRETKAFIDQIAAGLRSPQEICASRGRDFEEVLTEIAEAKSLAEEKGLTLEAIFGAASTALANNPAKLGANDNAT